MITDDYTRFTWIFPLKEKSQTAKLVKDWLALMATNCPEYPVRRLRTDNGKECLVLKN